jgi:predicted CXXCH cytochrome family protein
MCRGVLLSLAGTLCSYAGPGYTGAAACAKCHINETARWTNSRHSKMLQPASATSVKGDFTRGTVTLRNSPYKLSRRDGAYYITETYLTGKPQEHRVEYTLGNRRIQHYLTTLPGGRIVVLPPSWDVLRKEWFHNFDIGDPDETSEVMVQVWNKSCFSCHVSQQEKGFDPETNQYKTAWLDFGTNCERCHGPGSDHVANYSAAQKPAGPARDIVMQTRLDPARNTEVCAQCHSFRDIYVDGYAAGANYYDHFLPILEASQPVDKDPAYWPDGRTRRFSNDAFGLWQSECYLKGKAVCTTCHTAAHETEIERNPQLRPDANALCAQCHEAIGKASARHSRHTEKSTGDSCVECHMPRTVLSIKAEIRDHSMSVPAPENTARHQIPNACNNCHRDRTPAWAAQRMTDWWGATSRAKWIRRADTFAAAAAGNAKAVAGLLAILREPAEGPFPRANAATYLPRFANDPRVYPALLEALRDAEPLVRATVALRIGNAAAKPELIRALDDPAATVRIGAVVSLVAIGVKELPGEDGERFARAKQLFEARARHNLDDAEQQIGAGRFYFLTGETVKAIEAFRGSLLLDPDAPAQYLLAAAYAQNRQFAESRQILEKIPATDPQYARAQRLLAALPK